MGGRERYDFDQWAEGVYLAEILMQCGFVLRARGAIAGVGEPEPGVDPAGLALAYQTFVTAAGAIARYINPSTAKRRDEDQQARDYRVNRGAALRRRLAIIDGSPLLDRRTVRNALEHMDLDLDAWTAVQP